MPEIKQLVYYPKAYIAFTRPEVAILLERSVRHYSPECKAAGQWGGFLFGINNRFLADDPNDLAEAPLSSTEVDILCKIMEGYSTLAEEELGIKLCEIGQKLEQEYRRLNPR